MSNLLHPVGPLPPSVYWRRRLVAIVIVLVVVALLWWLVSAVFGGSAPTAAPAATSSSPGPASASPASSPAASKSPAASGSASPTSSSTGSPSASAAAVPCPDSALAITVLSDRTVYEPTEDPRLTLKVTNTSGSACSRDVGPPALELVVKSGDVRVWSSDDCNPGGTSDVQVLAPGASDSVTVLWKRTRSAPGCPSGLGPATPGSYVASGRAGTLTGGSAAFTLK